MVVTLAGTELPAATLDALVARADGVPLYVEELTKAVVEPGAARGVAAIPATLADSLMARLDRLATAKEVAQRAAVLGREFSYALLAAGRAAGGGGAAPGAGAARRRGDPVRARASRPRPRTPSSTRWCRRRRTGRCSSARASSSTGAWSRCWRRFPERVAGEPEVVARHAEAAGLGDAITYYERAGERAQGRSAHEEAIGHLRRAIALVGTLHESPERDAREGRLQLALGGSLGAGRGYAHAETGAAYERVRVLGEAAGDVAQLARASWDSRATTSPRRAGRGHRARGAVLAIGEETRDDAVLVAGTCGRDAAALSRAVCCRARALRAGGRAVRPGAPSGAAFRYVTDHGVAALSHGAWTLWQLGQPERALARAREAVALARTLAQPFSLGFALFFEAGCTRSAGTSAAQRARSAELIALSEAQGFPLWLGIGRQFVGARAPVGGAAEWPRSRRGSRSSPAPDTRPARRLSWRAWQGPRRPRASTPRRSAASRTALAVAAETGQHFFDAELHRLKGALLLHSERGSAAEAEASSGARSTSPARRRRGRFELRAATSLARLLAMPGQARRGARPPRPVYAWFTEGFDTRDLVEAKALLDELT